MIQFTVPSVPVAQPRQRHRVMSLPGGRSAVKNYTPTKHPVNDFKATVRLALREAYKGAPLDGPLRVDLRFRMPRPKSKLWKKKPMPRLPHTGKPDADNLTKSVFDALKGLAWIDDSQISHLTVYKSVASGDEAPHVAVSIEGI